MMRAQILRCSQTRLSALSLTGQHVPAVKRTRALYALCFGWLEFAFMALRVIRGPACC